MVNGNTHQTLYCPYCNLCYYSKGALTTHVNAEHWRGVEELQNELVKAVEEKPAEEFITIVEDDI